MRIAVVSTPFIRVPPEGYGGTELFCFELTEELVRRGHDVTLFTTGDSTVSSRKKWLYASAQWPPNSLDEVNHMAWSMHEIREGDFDIVHLNSALGVPFSSFFSVPIVTTIHHGQDDRISRIYADYQDICYVTLSRRHLELEVPLNNARVIYHGISPSRYSRHSVERPSNSHRNDFLAHIGRFCFEKGTHLAIDIARSAGLPIKLAGRIHEQDRPYFEHYMDPRLGGSGVSLLGEANHETKLSLLSTARALLCPLQWEEPFGLIAIEAMMCGTPVLGFARGSFPEIVDQGLTGYFPSLTDEILNLCNIK